MCPASFRLEGLDSFRCRAVGPVGGAPIRCGLCLGEVQLLVDAAGGCLGSRDRCPAPRPLRYARHPETGSTLVRIGTGGSWRTGSSMARLQRLGTRECSSARLAPTLKIHGNSGNFVHWVLTWTLCLA